MPMGTRNIAPMAKAIMAGMGPPPSTIQSPTSSTHPVPMMAPNPMVKKLKSVSSFFIPPEVGVSLSAIPSPLRGRRAGVWWAACRLPPGCARAFAGPFAQALQNRLTTDVRVQMRAVRARTEDVRSGAPMGRRTSRPDRRERMGVGRKRGFGRVHGTRHRNRFHAYFELVSYR
jgi:hypothetical protein